jgi:lipoate-protein ligase A
MPWSGWSPQATSAVAKMSATAVRRIVSLIGSSSQRKTPPDVTWFPMIRIVTDSHPSEPGLDTGISHAVLRAVGEGRLGETFRIHRTERTVAFGRQDRVAAGYGAAVDAARSAGYLPVERLAGGRAAVFHEDTLALSWAIPDPDPRRRITARFETISGLLATAFADMGADARIGAVPGEYCRGEYSVNIAGRSKVMGVGQRLVRGAAHLGGVIVVDGGLRIAKVLRPVYRALSLDWDARTSGDLADHLPGISSRDVIDAVLRRLATMDTLVEDSIPDWVVAEGRRLAPDHIAPTACSA